MKKIFVATLEWLDDRLGITDLLGPSLKHLVPRDAKWWYVFGSATMLALIVQIVTGVALAFSYIPSSSQAYDTLKFITSAPFGSFLRGLHYYGASAMVLMVGAHMAQTFLCGAYKFPREMNWTTGIILLGMTLVMGFTGQLLRWDQTAAWSVVISAEQAGRIPWIGGWLAHFILGGDTIGGATLSRFFAIHVFLIPAFIFFFLALHLWLVLRHGISETPVAGRPVNPKTYRAEYKKYLETNGHPFWPDGAWRDFVFGTAMIIVIAGLAYFVGPPAIENAPDPTNLNANPRPDWYLTWYYAVLALIPPKMEGPVMIFAPLSIGFLLLIVPMLNNKGERAPSRRPWAIAVVLLSVIMIGSLWIAGANAPWSPNFDATPLPPTDVASNNPQIIQGAKLFSERGCIRCHSIGNDGGHAGPDLTFVGDKLQTSDIVLRIVNGKGNMPAYGSTLGHDDINAITAFLASRKHPLDQVAQDK
ncbi:MAG TPA: cytochrome b N-terminal domain-containing protein [Chthoniobacteraceae bacterium]|nr:cytochrome b N-terminal domain-containing protein [Chthoniobacteraceae bacterium]